MKETALIALVLALIGGLMLPWWSIGLGAFVAGAWRAPSALRAYGAGFLGVGLLWFSFASFIHLKSGGLLTERIAEMAGGISPIWLIVITGVTGGIAGALASTTGFYFRPTLIRLHNSLRKFCRRVLDP